MSLGLYLHFPFCLRKCAYCDFASFPGIESLIPFYLAGLRTEFALDRSEIAGRTFSTLYLGGGTPSLIPAPDLAALLAHFSPFLAPGAEITMEANPETLDRARLDAFASGGGNRLSLGLQTHEERLLHLLGRAHDAAQTKAAVTAARAAGIPRVSLDLIYGLPGQTRAGWEETLSFALSLAPDHISAYSLELHSETPLARQVEAGVLSLPGEDEVAAMHWAALARLREGGLGHYEIANYACPGAECRHNLIYWHNGEYLGLGAAAHSHLRNERRANLRTPQAYLAALSQGVPPVDFREELDRRQELLETIMLGLRLREGIDTAIFPARFGGSAATVFGSSLAELIEQGLVMAGEGRLRLTDRGVLLADYVLRKLTADL